MEIRLDLSRHCIQTAARLKLEHLIRQCLKAPDQETEEMIEALTDFLSQNDFGQLRRHIDLSHKFFKEAPDSLIPLDRPMVSFTLFLTWWLVLILFFYPCNTLWLRWVWRTKKGADRIGFDLRPAFLVSEPRPFNRFLFRVAASYD